MRYIPCWMIIGIIQKNRSFQLLSNDSRYVYKHINMPKHVQLNLFEYISYYSTESCALPLIM